MSADEDEEPLFPGSTAWPRRWMTALLPTGAGRRADGAGDAAARPAPVAGRRRCRAGAAVRDGPGPAAAGRRAGARPQAPGPAPGLDGRGPARCRVRRRRLAGLDRAPTPTSSRPSRRRPSRASRRAAAASCWTAGPPPSTSGCSRRSVRTSFLEAQRRLLDAMLASRAAERELVEIGAKAADMPTRAELDDVHKTLHAVKRELRALQRQLAGAEQKTTAGQRRKVAAGQGRGEA